MGLSSAPNPIAELVASSLMLLASLAPIPFRVLVSALLRVSLAFTSTGVKPSSLQKVDQHNKESVMKPLMGIAFCAVNIQFHAAE